MNKSIYIAGPMSGYEKFNYKAFREAEKYLRSKDWNVISPVTMDEESGFFLEAKLKEWENETGASVNSTPWKLIEPWLFQYFNLAAAVKRDIDAVIKCDAIYMLEGWENSRGAKGEHTIAIQLNKIIYYQSTI